MPTPRQERQAIFLGATEPTRCPTGKESAAGVMLVGQGGLAVSITTRSGTMPIRELLKAESAVFGPDELRDIAAAFEVIRERLGLIV